MTVSAIDALALLGISGDAALVLVAREVDARLRRALERLEHPGGA